jgi:hypothetical protein
VVDILLPRVKQPALDLLLQGRLALHTSWVPLAFTNYHRKKSGPEMLNKSPPSGPSRSAYIVGSVSIH